LTLEVGMSLRPALGLALFLTLGTAPLALAQPFYLHHSASPVPVACGTSNFFLDETAPTASVVTVEDHSIVVNTTSAYPVFTGQPLAAQTRLRAIASARLNFSASQQMKNCVDLTVELRRLSGGCAETSIGTATVTGESLSQGKAHGTAGFSVERVEFPLTDRDVQAGEALVLLTSVTNGCSVNRHVFLAYDAAVAQSRVVFQCCLSAASKCASKKIKAAAKTTAAQLKCDAKAFAKGEPIDAECLQKAQDKLTSSFAKLDANGDCPTTNDAAPVLAVIDAFVADVQSELAPSGTVSRCTSRKFTVTGGKVVARSNCEGKAMAKGNEVDPECLAKAGEKLTERFLKAEGYGDCLAPTGDASAIEDKVDDLVTDFVTRLRCPCASPSGAFLEIGDGALD
jgi:hypothetical protein